MAGHFPDQPMRLFRPMADIEQLFRQEWGRGRNGLAIVVNDTFGERHYYTKRRRYSVGSARGS